MYFILRTIYADILIDPHNPNPNPDDNDDNDDRVAFDCIYCDAHALLSIK